MAFYGERVVDTRIDALFAELPAISIEGARGVGKTTTARQRAATFLALDDAPVLELLQADPRVVGGYPPPVVIDEWQRVPAVFDAVRRAVDEDRSAGRFLITGSASPRQPPTRNPLAKLTSGPKHHLVDPALATTLLGIDGGALLRGERPGTPDLSPPPDRALLGRLFESLVALNLRVYAQAARASLHYMRKRAGEREIDFIVSARDGRVLAVEAKLSGSVSDHDVRHLNWLRREAGDDVLDAAVITTGPHAYRRRDGIAVIPAALLGP